ncbi:MAG: hypothetical protein IPP90_11805 [Gemmatimonadaceae bacterium]|nr:hypothetical protein [Gemmatimonadaceae bacterium]
MRAGTAVACVVIAGVMAVTRLGAQPVAPRGLAARHDVVREPAEPEGWHLEQCMAGLTYGAPLKWALSYGGGLLHESNSGPDVCTLAVAKVGLGGAQMSLGAGTSFAPWGSGIMVTGNVLRTFGAPLKATPRRTYVGASLHIWPALAIGGELGYYVRLGDAAGASSSGKRLVAWSVGFGF